MNAFEPFTNAAPARYAIESDSSDSEFEDPEAGHEVLRRRHKRPLVQRSVTIESGTTATGKPLVVALDEAGQYWSSCVRLRETKGNVKLDEVQVAALAETEEQNVLLAASDDIPLHLLHELVEKILNALQPSSLQIIDHYSVDAYLSPSRSNSDPPIRYLQTANDADLPSSCEIYDVPNLHTGLAASFLSEANQRRLPARLVLLPSSASQYGHTRARPEGIYDPAPLSTLSKSAGNQRDPVLLAALRRADASALGWPTFEAASAGHASTAWQWLEMARKQRARARREDNPYLAI